MKEPGATGTPEGENRAMTEEFRMQVYAEPRLLASVRGAVKAYLANAGTSQDRIEEAVLAVDEACTNCIRHAYGGDPSQTFEVALASDESTIQITVRDTGAPCPDEKLERRELAPPSIDDLMPGGLGIQLIHRVFDDVAIYTGQEECGERGNTVEMRLHRTKDTGGGCSPPGGAA